MTEESVHADTDAAFRWLARRRVAADQMGVVGFGLGGAVALIVATQRDFGAAVTIGGIGVMEPVAATFARAGGRCRRAALPMAGYLRSGWGGA